MAMPVLLAWRLPVAHHQPSHYTHDAGSCPFVAHSMCPCVLVVVAASFAALYKWEAKHRIDFLRRQQLSLGNKG